MTTFLEGFSVTGHEKMAPSAQFEGIKRVQGAPPDTGNQVKVVMSKVILSLEKDKRATTNLKNGLVIFFLLSLKRP